MRRQLTFDCQGEKLFASLDEATGPDALLIVSGGNEIRSGAHAGQAQLSAKLADNGIAVMRYDRRGIGDSTGQNGGFFESAPDIAAAVSALRHEAPQAKRITAFGNCDAATALALFHANTGIASLILSNPWVIEQEDSLPPPEAVRARYAQKLKDPAALWELATGKVNLARLFAGIRQAGRVSPPPGNLASRLGEAIAGAQVPVTLLAATGDRTAQAFLSAWKSSGFAAARQTAHLMERDTSSHSYIGPGDREWLIDTVIGTIRRQSG